MSPTIHKSKALFVAVGIAVIVILVGWSYTASRSELLSACNIAYIPIHGSLVTYIPESQGTTSGFASDQTSSEDVTQSIRSANADPSIEGIVLEVDSPGGSPVAGEEIQAALKRSSKPTVALIRNEGDSAAYLAASGATSIFASAFSVVGDIGITQSYVDNSKQNLNNGLTFNQLSVGKYKDMFSSDKQLTPDEHALAMKELQIDYATLVSITASNRHMGTDTMTTLADGSSVTGSEAVHTGLIDHIGNVDDVRTFLTGKIANDAVICGIDSNR